MNNVLRILQLSDLHLKQHDQAILDESLESVVAACQKDKDWPPHYFILSGDLVHDETTAGYSNCYKKLTRRFIDIAPLLAIPGNHDDSALLHRDMGIAGAQTTGWLEQGNWQIILLDSSVTGHKHGHLGKQCLKDLDTALTRRKAEYSLIIIHHPPVEIGSRWMDRMKVDNGEALFELTAKYCGVHHLVCGHAHQEIDLQHQHIRILGAPATCRTQYLPLSDEYAEDTLSAGARWLELHEDGRLNTGIIRTQSFSHSQ